jgi:UDP:flavonoid glycosyltransferase YjiC (YdhE family)
MSDMTNNKVKKIFVLILPLSGHINPVTSIIHELTSRHHVDITFYAEDQFKPMVERTGATYKSYAMKLHKEENIKENSNPIVKMVLGVLRFSDTCLPSLIADIERERPDLILYDLFSLHAKYLLEIFHQRYNNKLTDYVPPQAVMVSQFFGVKQGIFPNKDGLEFTRNYDDIWYWFYVVQLIAEQLRLSWKYGLRIVNPYTFLFENGYEKFKIVTVFPEFQPKLELFDDSYKFVGNGLSESVRTVETIKDLKLKQVLDLFQPNNPINSIEEKPQENLRLIYVSLGTIFNDNLFVFETIINAIKLFKARDQAIKFEDLWVVMSLGNSVYKKFQVKISEENYELAENIVLCASVPQVELLKRTSLFITHAGMNSASEAVHYAVPVLCIPMQIDQPLVARRIADELRLGKNYNPLTLDASSLHAGISEILMSERASDGFLTRIIEFSKISRMYNGGVTGCKLIVDVLQSVEKKKQ